MRAAFQDLSGVRHRRVRSLRKAAVGAVLTATVAEFATPLDSWRAAWIGGAIFRPELLSAGEGASDASSRLEGDSTSDSDGVGRRECVAVLAGLAACALGGRTARAIVRGYEPPKGYGIGKGDIILDAGELKCGKEMSECVAKGDKIEGEKYPGQVPKSGRDFNVSKSGARWKDLKVGVEADGVAQVGSDIKIKYRIMRAGKRSYDGLSGEATTLFSIGFGEDDGPKDATLNAPLGAGQFVKALDEALVGMAVGGVRRVQVRPDYNLGWKKPGKCAEKIDGVGAIAGLPFVGVEREGACLVKSLLPQPTDWASQRRFERRFDESLIAEVELVGLGK